MKGRKERTAPDRNEHGQSSVVEGTEQFQRTGEKGQCGCSEDIRKSGVR